MSGLGVSHERLWKWKNANFEKGNLQIAHAIRAEISDSPIKSYSVNGIRVA
jgi:hypothetical protein